MAAQETRDLAGAVDSTDPEVGLAAVAALRTLVERLEALHVANARERGWSWQEIGGALGVSKQDEGWTWVTGEPWSYAPWGADRGFVEPNDFPSSPGAVDAQLTSVDAQLTSGEALWPCPFPKSDRSGCWRNSGR